MHSSTRYFHPDVKKPYSISYLGQCLRKITGRKVYYAQGRFHVKSTDSGEWNDNADTHAFWKEFPILVPTEKQTYCYCGWQGRVIPVDFEDIVRHKFLRGKILAESTGIL